MAADGAQKGPNQPEWTRQFGSNSTDTASDVGVDSSGNVYVTGSVDSTLPGQMSAGLSDAFLIKFDGSGVPQWTRQLGTSGLDGGGAMSVDSSGNVYVVGSTTGTFSGPTNPGGYDAFVTKYDDSGTAAWAQQLSTDETDTASGVSVDSSGNVYVAGNTRGTLPEQTSEGATDAFVAKYDSSGTLEWHRQFGTSGDEYAYDVGVDSSGNAYVAGHTTGVLSGQSSAGAGDAFVTKFDSSGAREWTQQIGTSGYDQGSGVSVDSSGNAYVTGYTNGALPGQTSAGLSDAFVMKYDSSGALQWTWQFGGSGNDYGYGSTVNASGHAYVAGFTTGALTGQTSAGGDDAFVEQVVP